MPKPYSVVLGKAVRTIAKLRGGGSALPGLFIEKIDRHFVPDILSSLPQGVVVISGTNGKTTTTKIVVELLESQGLKVFTNRTGSNFSRGVAAALLGEIDRRGNLSADIAVLELDEAHAVHFAEAINPRYSLLLNVMRDQLDRFGEIDTTAQLLEKIAINTSEKVIINREDPRLLRVAKRLPKEKVVYFGLDTSLEDLFPSDDEMRGAKAKTSTKPLALATLEELHDRRAVFSLQDKKFSATLQLEGVYNVFNAAAALSLVASICGDSLDKEKLVEKLQTVTPAFGRGESIIVNGQTIELVLVKNPSGFRLGLKSFPPEGHATMIAINDNYADGRDMSWLWDVDFESLKTNGVSAITGIRAYDMALRLQYDEIEVSHVDTNLKKSLKEFLARESDKPMRIYCSYTAMLAVRRELSKIANVETIS